MVDHEESGVRDKKTSCCSILMKVLVYFRLLKRPKLTK